MNKLLVLALGLSVILMSGSLLADVESTAQDVAQELPSPRVVDCVLKDRDNGRFLETVDEQLSVLTYPCSGGLYLLDSAKDFDAGLFSGNLTPLVQGWFFHDSQATERISDARLRVTARFVTGVGPKGARAFYASIPVTRVDGVWQSGEPTHGKAPAMVTKDLKTTTVWYILPKDDRPLGSDRPESFALLTPVEGARSGGIETVGRYRS